MAERRTKNHKITVLVFLDPDPSRDNICRDFPWMGRVARHNFCEIFEFYSVSHKRLEYRRVLLYPCKDNGRSVHGTVLWNEIFINVMVLLLNLAKLWHTTQAGVIVTDFRGAILDFEQ
ncbi:hypothetical protein AVEN_156047-1 [Araneus ventricosus]|uniref:Uncharacterized protein n=1 Tax=Araneus ventricosus TaxID=182803 RepID=A0A4Y1ZM32_ARAVE|nr:hypothetical protein AVEN_156047-1 [Araneus ventricosus]